MTSIPSNTPSYLPVLIHILFIILYIFITRSLIRHGVAISSIYG